MKVLRKYPQAVLLCAAMAFLSLALLLPMLGLSGCSRAQNDGDGANASAADASAAQVQNAPDGQAEKSTLDGMQAAGGDASSYALSLGFIGDICFADNYIPLQHLAELGSDDIADGIDPIFIQIMRKMDLMWANNEFVYSDRGEALEGKAWTFRSKPGNVKYLHDLGVDVVGLANNHTYDYGEEAFLDTLATLEEAGIPYTGAGRNEGEARGPVYLRTHGFTIAYVNASSAEYTIYTPEATQDKPGIAWCYDNTKFLEDIHEAAANADFVVALPHWGTEHSTELIWEQTNGARECIDAGADAVIGAHTHILQGLEYYKGKPIFYSLGNFWFDDYDIDTVVAELRISGEGSAKTGAQLRDGKVELILYPGTQSGVCTKYANTPEERDRIFRYLESISINVTIDEHGIVHESDSW